MSKNGPISMLGLSSAREAQEVPAAPRTRERGRAATRVRPHLQQVTLGLRKLDRSVGALPTGGSSGDPRPLPASREGSFSPDDAASAARSAQAARRPRSFRDVFPNKTFTACGSPSTVASTHGSDFACRHEHEHEPASEFESGSGLGFGFGSLSLLSSSSTSGPTFASGGRAAASEESSVSVARSSVAVEGLAARRLSLSSVLGGMSLEQAIEQTPGAGGRREAAPAMMRVVEQNEAFFDCATTLEQCCVLASDASHQSKLMLLSALEVALPLLDALPAELKMPLGSRRRGWIDRRLELRKLAQDLATAREAMRTALDCLEQEEESGNAQTRQVQKDFLRAAWQDLGWATHLALGQLFMVAGVMDTDPFHPKRLAEFETVNANAAAILARCAAGELEGDASDGSPLLLLARDLADGVSQPIVRLAARSGDEKPVRDDVVAIERSYRQLLAEALKDASVNGPARGRLGGALGWRRAFAESLARQRWPVLRRTFVASVGERSAVFENRITPAARIDERYADAYAQNVALDAPLAGSDPAHAVAPRRGVSAYDIENAVHPRNLKISQLFRSEADAAPLCLGTVVGHGVLDAWGIADREARRQANANAAREVLDAAVISLPRVGMGIGAGSGKARTTPLSVTHVSVNLLTPETMPPWRPLPGDVREHAHIKAQFEAFEEASKMSSVGGGALAVAIDAITFSFGIDARATETHGWILRPWRQVQQHNLRSMVRLIGNPRGNAREAPIGGFIGSVLDGLAEDEPQGLLKRKLQAQAERVGQLFASEAYQTGNGDPAKMAREILYLQILAERALAMSDRDRVATASRDCLGDEDRGLVVDAELKFRLASDHLGLEVRDDVAPEGELGELYQRVLLASGAFEIQAWNTGLPGSKAMQLLAGRGLDKPMLDLLTGMSEASWQGPYVRA